MIGKFLNSRSFFFIVSIIFAFFLFFNVNSTSEQNQGITNIGGQIYSTTLNNLPIDIRYDQERYFITGYDSSANVSLSSYNQIKLLQEESLDLRSFSLFSDLTELSIGTHEVPIKINNLPQAINAEITPNMMNVTIERRVKQNFQVTHTVDDRLIPEGYTIDIELSPETVTVTAGTTSIKNISEIRAVLPSNVDLNGEYSGQINIIAVDRNGHVVPAILSESSIKMTIKLLEPVDTSDSSN